MFIYPDKKILTLEELSRDAFPELRENTRKARLSMADAIHAIFTKTVKDKAPEHQDDKLFWYWAMFFKSVFFEKDTTVLSGKKGHLSAYYLTSTWDGKAEVNKAVIVNGNSPIYALKLDSANMTFDEFKSIIGTIKEKEETN